MIKLPSFHAHFAKVPITDEDVQSAPSSVNQVAKLSSRLPQLTDPINQALRCRHFTTELVPLRHVSDQRWDKYKEEVLSLFDISKISEEQCIYQECLRAEKSQIRVKLKDPCFSELINFINGIKNPTIHRRGVAALFVVIGIKPVLIFEDFNHKSKKHSKFLELRAELLSILEKIAMAKDYLSLTKDSKENYYFVNEKPLDCFEPRNFLKESIFSNPQTTLKSLSMETFTSSDFFFADQVQSYLLGYGPVWESFVIKSGTLFSGTPKDFVLFTRESFFNDEHYRQIGKVLEEAEVQDLGFMDTQLEPSHHHMKLGQSYHSHLPSLFLKTLPPESSQNETKMQWYMKEWGTSCVFDGIALRTDYFRKSFTLKKWVWESYLS